MFNLWTENEVSSGQSYLGYSVVSVLASSDGGGTKTRPRRQKTFSGKRGRLSCTDGKMEGGTERRHPRLPASGLAGTWSLDSALVLPAAEMKLVGTDVASRLPYGIQTLTDFSLPFQRERGRHFLQSQSLNPLQLIAHLMDDDTISSSLVFTTTSCPSRPGASQSQSERQPLIGAQAHLQAPRFQSTQR